MTEINLEKISIVHWYPELEKHKCGYCKTENSAVSYGMWAEQLSVHDYQNLVDRGWRRSGMYCYKAIMNETCCPLYTIRCKAMDFSPSKSHKKIIKKFNKFINDGIVPLGKDTHNIHNDISHGNESRIIKPRPNLRMNLSGINKPQENLQPLEQATQVQDFGQIIMPGTSAFRNKIENKHDSQNSTSTLPIITINKPPSFQQGLGADPTKPLCRKAKLIRLEKRQKKLSEHGMNVEKCVKNEPKTLEQFLNEIPETSKYKLKIKHERVNKNHHNFKACAALFKKYQMTIHKEPLKECGEKQFCEFLIDTPLKTVRTRGQHSGAVTYGTFHQQYWLDDKLLAVAVLDILPHSVSSVYFFYDPDYKFLTLGTYGALREIHFVQSLHKIVPSIEYYNMGFYIHSCPKMRYKSQFNNSCLLCPETYTWCSLEKCLPKLQFDKYSRLTDDIDAIDENECTPRDIDNIKVYTYSNIMLFRDYKNKHAEQEIFDNIGKFIGKKCAGTLLFVTALQ